MQVRRLDDDTVLLELEGESIIVLSPKSEPPEEMAKAMRESAARLEKRAAMYRSFSDQLLSGTKF
jgi:hypothetical protein